ncbi:MAG: MinD/ParA family protein [Nitrospirales bacterium]|nr:MinD/ParA family protein [Nitrospirales bacterium]
MMSKNWQRPIKTVTVTSGKGGVGKTNMVASLAVALAKSGKKVMILDADLGLSNIDVLFDIAPKYTIQHVLNGEKRIEDVIAEGPYGIKILPASSGVQELTEINEFQRMKLMEEFDSYREDLDFLLIDTGAGISQNVAFFCIASQESIVVTSPEPTALTDAYALIKVLFTRYQEKGFKVLVNSARNSEDAREVFRRLSLAAEKFLNISLDYLGFIPYDDSIPRAVRMQRAFVDAYPNCKASENLRLIAAKMMEEENGDKVRGSLQLFLGNMLRREAVVHGS